MGVLEVRRLLVVPLALEIPPRHHRAKETMAVQVKAPQTQITALVVEAALVALVEIWLLEAQVEQAVREHLHQSRVQRLQEHGVVLAAASIAWEQPLLEAKETQTAQAQVPILAVAATER
jgi:hypothetical protein